MLRSELENRIKQAEMPEYESDEAGNRVKTVKDTILFEGEDAIDIYCIENRDGAQLLEIIENAETAYAVDLRLWDIVMEEVNNYFEKGKDMDEVLNIIQSRASVYVAENYG